MSSNGSVRDLHPTKKKDEELRKLYDFISKIPEKGWTVFGIPRVRDEETNESSEDKIEFPIREIEKKKLFLIRKFWDGTVKPPKKGLVLGDSLRNVLHFQAFVQTKLKEILDWGKISSLDLSAFQNQNSTANEVVSPFEREFQKILQKSVCIHKKQMLDLVGMLPEHGGNTNDFTIHFIQGWNELFFVERHQDFEGKYVYRKEKDGQKKLLKFCRKISQLQVEDLKISVKNSILDFRGLSVERYLQQWNGQQDHKILDLVQKVEKTQKIPFAEITSRTDVSFSEKIEISSDRNDITVQVAFNPVILKKIVFNFKQNDVAFSKIEPTHKLSIEEKTNIGNNMTF